MTKPRRALVAVVLAGAVPALAVAAFLLSGYRLFAITNPSMGIVAPVGSVVVTHPDPDYHVGQLVTFRMDDRLYTHRIVDGVEDAFVTKGDLNGAVDGWRTSTRDIVGGVTWSCPGLGWVLLGAPWLLLGAALVELVGRAKFVEPSWRWPIRLAGWPLTIMVVALWLRPWLNMQLLDFEADTPDSVLMHVVNTGLLPMRADTAHLVSGQDAVLRVGERAANGSFTLTPTPDLTVLQHVVIIVVCLVPLLVALFVRRRREPDAEVESTEPDATATRSRRVLVLAVCVITVVAVVSTTTLTSMSAFGATIRNAVNGAGTATYFTCQQAETSLGASSTYAVYKLGTSGVTAEADLSGNNRTGRYATSSASTASDGCQRDTPKASVTFNGTSQCLYVPGSVNTPNTFTLEAWFRTSTKSNGKVIGFGSVTGSAADGSYDRHIYISPTGRILFGVYPNTTVVIGTAAATNYADNTWHHVVAALSSAGMALYADGTLTSTNPSVTTAQSFTGYWKIGCGNLTGWSQVPGTGDTGYNGPSYFTGQVQYAAIYSVALTAADVRAHYLAGPPSS